MVNFTYFDNFHFLYVSFRIDLDAPPERLFIQKAVSVCLEFGRADDLLKHAPSATARSTHLQRCGLRTTEPIGGTVGRKEIGLCPGKSRSI